MWSKTIKVLLTLLLFVMIWSKISNTFDGDLGWHLRFGKDALSSNLPAGQAGFQYKDSYTYSYFGQAWTNHEWGGDVFFWWIYSHLGYYFLVMLVTSALFASFFLAARMASGKTTIAGLVVAIFLAQASTHIFVMRLAMLAPLFFIICWYSLRKIPEANYYWFWPVLFCLWSALHGSWILGFIVINIYVVGNLGQMIIFRLSRTHPCLPDRQAYPPPLRRAGALAGITDSMWRKADFIKVILAQIFSLLAVAINPYGFKILFEVSSYFSQAYFKGHITEWLPSYTYPVFWASLAWSAVALFLAILLAARKKINLPDLLLVGALFISGFEYKRNAIFILLAGIPLIAGVVDYAMRELGRNIFPQTGSRSGGTISKILGQKFPRVIILVCGLSAIISLLIFCAMKIKIYDDVWTRSDILFAHVMPYNATEFLKKRIGDHQDKIFNEFNWGGYLNWKLPGAFVYLDGRGTATWINPRDPKATLLETYMGLRYDPDGLKQIEKEDVKYIFLKDSRVPVFARPDWVNRFIFGDELKPLFEPLITELNKDLNNSNNWKLIYSDGLTNIWERK